MDTLKVDNRCRFWAYVLTMTSAGFVFGSTFTMFNNFFDHYMNARFPATPHSERDSILMKINTFTGVGQLLISLMGPILFQRFQRRHLFVFCSCVVIATSVGTVFCGLWLFYALRLVQGMFAFYYQVFVNVYLKETLPVRDVGIAGSVFYIFMSLGYIFSFYMKYPWTETYYWLPLLVPALVETLRLTAFVLFFRFEGPKFVYFALKKRLKGGQEAPSEDSNNLIDSVSISSGSRPPSERNPKTQTPPPAAEPTRRASLRRRA